MGMPSIGIYSYELIHTFGCKKLIRVRIVGAMQETLIYIVIIHKVLLITITFNNINYQVILRRIASYQLLKKQAETARDGVISRIM